jgi:mannose-6-phosphate isomerase-like protein (cupin superfamily)
MKLQLRRVVTGHDKDGRAVVKIDEGAKNIISSRPGISSCVVWSTKGFPRNHRTDSIDYAVVISGEIDMELDDNVVVKLKAGDALVQRGTIHNWVNRGTEDCVIAFVLVSAKPATAGGKPLNAVG